MIITLALKKQCVGYRKFEIYTYKRLKPHHNGFPLKTCGNDADGVIPAGIAGIQIFRKNLIFKMRSARF